MANKIKEGQNAKKVEPQLASTRLFSEQNYGPFDTDAVRPVGINPAPELRDTALVHVQPVQPLPKNPKAAPKKADHSTISRWLGDPVLTNPGPPSSEVLGAVEHRAKLHNNASLPPQPIQQFISAAAQ